MTSPQPRPTVLRATSSAVAFWATAALAGVFIGDALIRGAWTTLARWLPLILLIVWAVWLVLYRSSIRVTDAEAVVVNLARTHAVPWSRVEAVERGPQVVLELWDGRRITCWGGPFPRKMGLRRRENDAQTDVVQALDGARDAAVSSSSPVVSRWDVPVLVVGVVLATASVLAPAMIPG